MEQGLHPCDRMLLTTGVWLGLVWMQVYSQSGVAQQEQGQGTKDGSIDGVGDARCLPGGSDLLGLPGS